MRKLLLSLLLLVTPAFATNSVSIAPTSAGGNTGIDCADAKAYTYFNTAGSWSATPIGIQIGPGTTVNMCSGNYTSQLLFQGDGSAGGGQVTLKFLSGATMNVPVWGGNGAIYSQGGASRQYVTVDGGGVGVISSTNNGSPGGGFANAVDAGGIFFPVCNNCEIKGFNGSGIVGPTYQHTDPNDVNNFGDAIDIHGGSNDRIDNNALVDSSHCITFSLTGTQTNIEIDHNVGHHCNWGTVVGSAGNIALSNFKWHDNEFYDFANWDNPTCIGGGCQANCCHHNGLHLFLEQGDGSSTIVTAQAYNNYCHGDPGTLMTSCMYIESNSGTNTGMLLFNNICWFVNNAPTNGCVNTKGNSNGAQEYNNIWGYPVLITGAKCIEYQGGSLTSKNNIFYNCYEAYFGAGGTLTASDYNVFFGTVAFGPSSGANTTLAAWRTASGGDANSNVANPLLNGSFVPQAGSSTIGAGLNLTSLGNTNLDLDKALVSRPLSLPWDIGAYQFAPTFLPPPPAPCNACMAEKPEMYPQKNAVQVVWDTMVPTTATVKYGLTPGYGKKLVESSGLVITHQFELVKLKPSTTYHLQLFGQDQDGNVITTPDEVFATQ